ncbi:FAD-binding oxidoreductase [Novosphingobium humi]|uniref:FAD-binding oxidoreductase n=1 Tax=Novosphingobium humi TaxID=2282397 RepID=A0ABY7U373_9SPHN|nr:FAD-binding oxidoreductase [Novosphingobium humi]WCT79942.1 FAD-binding oxidoreductase [Novosphingobium humi]
MSILLPHGMNAPAFDKALADFRRAIGDQWVLSGEEDRQTYIDPYAMGDGLDHDCSAILAPSSVEEVQAVIRIANQHKTPLWPVSRGKNLGYGASSPKEKGDLILDLSRMNRILDVNEKQASCLIEPGVGYFDLFRHLRQHAPSLWMSVPGNSWGSVIGNALDRGIGYTPYGDHCETLCGLEVVMPDGSLLRTGMGAMAGAKGWQSYKYGYGPGWDQMFMQSNLGVVVKAGLWLQPEPEMTAKITLALPRFDDAEWALDILCDLRRRDIIQHNIVFGSPVRAASTMSQRADWYDGPGALPDSVSEKMMAKLGLGWWNAKISLFGDEGSVMAQVALIRRLFEPRLGSALQFEIWKRGDPLEKSATGIPTTMGLQSVNWYGGRGGHLSFAPVLPQDGAMALAYAKKIKAYYEEVGQDYYASFTIGRRHINNVSLILYNRDEPEAIARVDKLYRHLLKEAAASGFGEYRGHISYMDEVAATYDFADGALARLNNRVKSALDPNNIIAPGRNGIGSRAHGGDRP